MYDMCHVYANGLFYYFLFFGPRQNNPITDHNINSNRIAMSLGYKD